MPDTLAPDTLPARRTPEQQIAELQAQLDGLREHASHSKTRPDPVDAPPISSIAKRRVVRKRRGGPTLIAPSPEADVPDSLAQQLQTRIDAFAADLVQLIRRSTFEAMQAVMDAAATSEDATSNEPTAGSLSLTPIAVGPTRRRAKRGQVRSDSKVRASPARSAPMTFADYERMAIERALVEAGGDVVAAGKALSLTRSAIYRHIRRHKIRTPASGGTITISPDDPLAASGEPASLDAYEKACIVRAMDQAGGNVEAAAKLIRSTKSTVYRRMEILGIPRPSDLRD